ncbi:MAG: hypothetical protein LBS43_02285 [Prevotellaceae bacterium]|jgi:hypothetical protein|nr:hypothetical protein [Prevotellaceae bacterium]
MLITGLIITNLLGLGIVLSISQQLKWTEILGLMFPAGIGVQTFMMVCLDFVGIPLTATTVIIGSILLIGALSACLYHRRNRLKEWIAPKKTGSYPKINWLWVLSLVAITIVCVMNIAKTMYYSTFDTDSVRGFNLIGMAVAHEGTIKNLSLYTGANFQPMTHNLYMTYTPLAQLGYAYLYMLGAETSKIFNALIFISFIFSFYGVTSRFATRTLTALTTFFVIITPEMLGFSSMSGTNFTHALYASLAILYFIAWYYKKNPSFLWLAAALLMLNNWTRNEGLAFIGAAVCVLCWESITVTKQYKKLILFTALCLFPFIFWQIFLKVNHLEIAQLIIFKPYWDSEKASLIGREMWILFKSSTFYGFTFIAFLLVLLSNVWHIFKKSDHLVTIILILLSWLFYTIMVYQIDYVWDSLDNVMKYSYKRFMFSFVPLLWFYVAAGKNINLIFEKIDDFIWSSKKKKVK